MIGLIEFSNASFNYRYKGYTAIINQTIDVAIDHFSKYNNTNLIISDQQVLDFFKPVYNSVNFDYNLISYDGNPLHFSNNRKKTNKDFLLDVYVLSNCNYFLYCYSNVSYLALTLGFEKQKHIKNINDEN